MLLLLGLGATLAEPAAATGSPVALAWGLQDGTAGDETSGDVDFHRGATYVVSDSVADPSDPELLATASVARYTRDGMQDWKVEIGAADAVAGASTEAVAVAPGAFGVVVAADRSYNGPGSARLKPPFVIERRDVSGALVWESDARTLGLPDFSFVSDLTVVGDSVYVAGWYVVDTTAETFDTRMLLQQVSLSDGAAQGRRLSGPGERWTQVEAAGRSVVLAGTTASRGAAGTRAVVRRLGRDTLRPRWTRRVNTSGDEAATALAVRGNRIYLAGTTTGQLAGQSSAGGRDAFLAAFSGRGRPQWQRQVGGAQDDAAPALAAGPRGPVLVAARTDAPYTPTGVLLEGFSRGGSPKWSTSVDTADYTVPTDAAWTARGLVVLGMTQDELFAPAQGRRDVFLAHYRVG